MGITASALGAIGGTPLIQLRSVLPAASAGVLVKDEPVDASHDRGYPLRSVKLIFRSAECMLI